MDKNNSILNRVFTKNTFFELMSNNTSSVYCSVIKRYLINTDSKDNKMLISEVYRVMGKNYRNEYYYKNTLLNKLLLGKHSLRTTTALTEIPICKSKADFVLINGKAVVYEIKTELDTFDRLASQLNNYYKAFNHVCVVTCESNFQKIKELLEGTPVGIYILTDQNTISVRREPTTDNSKLDYDVMFRVLRKKEYENIIMGFYGALPKTTQVRYYRECYNLFKEINIDTVYKLMIKELKKRNKIDVQEYQKYVPYELKFLMYFSELKKDDYIKLDNFLQNELGG